MSSFILIPPEFEIFIVLFLGLVLGSFSTALIWRIPLGKSWIFESKSSDGPFVRSACTECGNTLSVLDLVPFFSWCFLGGKCKYCRARIDCMYPLAELLTLAGCLGIYFAWGGLDMTVLLLCFSMPFLVSLFFIDLKHMILPDQLVFILAGIGVVFIFMQGWQGAGGGVAEAFSFFLLRCASAIFYFLSFWGLMKGMSVLLKKDAMGFGDVKFFGVCGLWLGFSYFPVLLILSGFLGLFTGAYYIKFRKQKIFPFGPALLMAFYVCILFIGKGFSPF